MKNAFVLPTTPLCKVVFTRGGTEYGAQMKTPKDIEDLRIAMQGKVPPVQTKDIVRIEAVQPLPPLGRNHPARNRMAQFAARD